MMDANWFKGLQRKAGLTSTDLGQVIGRDRTVISKILNGHQKMTLDQARALADALGVPISDMIERAGLGDNRTARHLSPGFSESDASSWTAQSPEDRGISSIAEALGQRPGIDIWRVKSSALALMGLLPGDFMLVDTDAAERVRAGDVVLAQIYDNIRGVATTVLRRFEPPVLVAASLEPDEWRVHIVDGTNVVVRGRVTRSWRQH